MFLLIFLLFTYIILTSKHSICIITFSMYDLYFCVYRVSSTRPLSRVLSQAFVLWSGHTRLHSGLDGSALHTTYLQVFPF